MEAELSSLHSIKDDYDNSKIQNVLRENIWIKGPLKIQPRLQANS